LRQAAIIPKPKSRRNFLRAVFSFLIESPFTQTMWVALAALCNFHDPVAMISCTIFLGCPKPKMSSIALVVSIRHHLNACSNTALLMNGTLEVLAPTISDHYAQRFHVSRVYSFIRDWDGG
jgi:hypothetical protein